MYQLTIARSRVWFPLITAEELSDPAASQYERPDVQVERERLSNASRNMLAMVFGQAMNTFLSAVCPLCRPSSYCNLDLELVREYQRGGHSVHGVFSARSFDESLPVVCDSRRTLIVLVTSRSEPRFGPECGAAIARLKLLLCEVF